MKGNALQRGTAGPEDVPVTLVPEAVEAEAQETELEAIHCLGRAGKGIPGRKHWSSFLLLCPAQMGALTFLKEGV